MQVLIIDNIDSFTYNIVDILRNIGTVDYKVLLSNELDPDELSAFDRIIISPGPMKPADFPMLEAVISHCSQSNKPLMGVCLGHQAICEYFGGELVQMKNVVHGQKKRIEINNNSPIYRNLPPEIEVGLYHSWMVNYKTLPHCLKITGMTADKCLMSVQHYKDNIFGIQFHPESFMTAWGKQILENFLNIQV
jgi:para-aminobenzoate synthetase component 2